jgi:DNA-binding transcriptional LysR family regulator
MDSLGSLNAFVQAAEARSFTVARRQLGVSSSAIGKSVARMEERRPPGKMSNSRCNDR